MPAARTMMYGLLAAAALWGQSGVRDGARKKMKQEIEAVKLPDAAFWDAGSRDHGLDPIVEKFKTTYFGILIDGPREVLLQRRETLPVFAYYMGTYQQTATRDFPRAAAVVTIRPDDNQIYAAPFVRKRGETILSGETVPAAQLPEGYLMTFQELDVRGRVELPWVPGRVISQVLLLDLHSNRLETRLVAGSGAFTDPEKEKFLAAERARMDPPAPDPAPDPAAGSADAGERPAAPAEMGVTLSAARVAVLDQKQRLPLQGSFRLPVLPEETVKPAHAAYNKAHGLMQGDGTPYAACVAIHLVVLSTAEETPSTYTLRLPVAKVIEVNGKPVASGTFAIDLMKLPDFPAGEQTLFIYAYAKEWMSEPATIGVVDRRRQP